MTQSDGLLASGTGADHDCGDAGECPIHDTLTAEHPVFGDAAKIAKMLTDTPTTVDGGEAFAIYRAANDTGPAARCWADITLRDAEHEFVRCGRGADHDGPHVGNVGQDNFVEWTDEHHA